MSHIIRLPRRDTKARRAILADAASILKNGGVILAPTDTVYGLLCRADNAEAIKRIMAMKRRSYGKAMPILVASRAQARAIAYLPPRASRFARILWPGPYTLVMHARRKFPDGVAAPDGSIGARLPRAKALRALVRRAGGPLAATSANISGKRPAQTARTAYNSFGAHRTTLPDLVVDGGRLTAPLSTVIDIRYVPPRVLRGTVPRRYAKFFRILP